MLTKADLQKEYLLVKAKLRLLKKEPTLATQLTSMSPREREREGEGERERGREGGREGGRGRGREGEKVRERGVGVEKEIRL